MFLLICSYVISQTTVQGRLTNLRKQFLPISSGSGHYRADGEVPYFELHRRQAGQMSTTIVFLLSFSFNVQ